MRIGAGCVKGDGGGAGGPGRGKSAAHCGTEHGAFGLKGLAAWIYFSFILSSPPVPAAVPASPPPAPMARIIRGRTGAGERRRGHAGPVGQGARPMTRADHGTDPQPASGDFPAAGQMGSAGGGDGADRAGAGGGPGPACPPVTRPTPDQTW